MKGVSLFSGAGISEHYFKDLGIDIILANEIIPKRANLYQKLYPKTKMICGDITNSDIFNKIIQNSKKIDFLIASPPCQGMSIAGKNRNPQAMMKDERNYLISKVIEFIKIKRPNYVLIENVPLLLKLLIPHNDSFLDVKSLLKVYFEDLYEIESKVLDAKDYGVPQTRKRAIIKMHKKGLSWEWPEKEEKIVTVKEAIGHLPSLRPGEKSETYFWHFARNHSPSHIEWMKHTPTGKSAFDNRIYFPKKENGEKIKGYNTTYYRMKWEEPSPTITIRNDAISSQRNVHPGKKLKDGTYSDPRVLTPLELFILTSLPEDWKVPKDTSEVLIRQCVGEAIPPLMIKKILKRIKMEESL
jgi:DNA (cytosine-5)-methyltransferase 1